MQQTSGVHPVQRLRSVIRHLRTSTGSATADVERAIVGLALILRVCVLVTMLTAVPEGVALATHVDLYLIVTATAVGFTIPLAWSLLRRGRPDLRFWGIADVTIAFIALPVIAHSFPANVQTGTWSVWAPGYALMVAVTTGAWARPRTVAILATAIGLCYLVVTAANSSQPVWSLLANALNYPMLALAAAWIAMVLRRFARQADRDREAAARAAAQLEAERYRLLVHDTTGILRLLASDELPEETREVVREQALAESVRLRSYLDAPPGEGTAPQTLGVVVREVIGSFRDLPIEPVLTLGQHAQLTDEAATVLRSALATTLHNVRRHARAHQVVIHADHRAGTWELTVRDDGVGFDPDPDAFGFGLATQVFEQAGAAGIEVVLDSAPGHGTALIYSGACADEEPMRLRPPA
ncbi:signal transduction histidine kinase [Branchiibius hedensis]|uniref:Signal transduction histidine kinase n=2 Tax=Branchiibius hedensis TaxID=672460 RepID=A0A2Y8ZTF1_9MICO|nr:signal transduction histidine kinase [Branchiibius hedensis]SSA34776.1 Signal transduction histidine kinase [Branchiibius hedensis]